ncbi:Vegetative incompatibility protein HET-E-1 [Ceratobasidium theobromae]|uniref:Vegetative incompatibility protein HET-E-1 n=1 Tax=Ceratobasidium theobromae TaxID=1582974 RepID=A0A5N5Q9C9_9AGAM|nr:Vegetative incompatibility protein HET-E-1 [Ceratobasidium theobromae]
MEPNPPPPPPPKRKRSRWYPEFTIKRQKVNTSSQSRPRPSSPTTRASPPAQPSNPATRNAAWEAVKATLRKLKTSAELVPALSTVFDGLEWFLGLFEENTRHRHDSQQLADHLNITLEFLRGHLANPSSVEITGIIKDVAGAVQKELDSIRPQQSQSGPSRPILTPFEEDELIGCYRRVDQLLHRLQLEIGMGAWKAANAANANLIEARLDRLKPVELATYNSMISEEINRRACTAKTRENVLREVNTWADDPDAEKIYWLDGMAGTGKTTIAYTLSEALQLRGQLAASFFCTRTDPECRDARRIVPTIAYQLAHVSTPFRLALGRALEKNPGVGSLNIAAQFEKILKDPLLEIKGKMSDNMVVVIDALDECDDSNIAVRVLDVLFHFASNLPIKFFVTSRPEPEIHKKVTSQDQNARLIMRLHEIEQSLVQADIELYLREELSAMSVSSTHLKQLVELAGNLFIFAATTVRYISPDDDTIDSDERLETMLSVDVKSDKKFEHINILYTTILNAAINNPKLEPKERDRRLLVLWTAVCAREQISVETLAALAGLKSSLVLGALQPLRSVLHISEHNSLVSTLHASFPDYIFDRDRSGDFACDEKTHNQFVVDRCFDIMKGQLKFNICNLESSFLRDENVPGLKTRIEQNISRELFYACRYWTDHLELAGTASEIHKTLEEFLSQRLPFWMEVLNLKECMVTGVLGLAKAQAWLTMWKANRDIIKLASDAHKFVARYAGHGMSQSTPHIYISAIPFCPESSSMWSHLTGKTRGLMKVRGTAIEGMALAPLATWSMQSGVNSAAFSPDGARIVSGSWDGTIRVWNAHDGTLVAGPFHGHTHSVTSVAFSPDGARIVSGSDDQTIRVWSAHDGTLVAGLFHGHTHSVTSVAFSPDGARIVSGSSDRTIRVWNAHDGTLAAGPFHDHTDSVTSVVFSPDGARIASGSSDRTIRVWNGHDGTLVAGPFHGHTHSVTSVAFSPDGARIVSGSWDRTIRVWNVHDGALVASPFHGHTHPVTSVAFSPDGARIVSGSSDRTIRVWNAHNDALVAGPFHGHTNWVRSVAFSPDGTRIVSGSSDRTIRVWNAHDGTLVAGPFHDHTDSVRSVAFSPDGARIVSGSSDRTIRVWNAHDGTLVAGLLHGHTHSVTSVAFSPDGARIVSGSWDRTIRVWNAHDGTLVAGPFHDHTDSVRSVAFSPDGARIVSGSSDRTIRVWHAHDGTLVAGPFHGHTHLVTSVVFSPDGARIVSGSSDRTIRVWSAHGGILVAGPFHGHTHPVTSVAFSPDRARIVSGSDDGMIRVRSSNPHEPYNSVASQNSSLRNHIHISLLQHEDWVVDSDGWFLNVNSELLFWVPTEIRP